MWIGIGIGINRNRYAQGIFNAYNLRVVADGGITEAGQCVDAVSSLLQSSSLLLIPSGYKGGKAYAEIPTNGNGDFSFARASDGTRINSEGLVEVCPWNFVQYSEEFSNAAWNKANVTVSANTTTAPNGTLTADLAARNSTILGCNVFQDYTSANSDTYTATIYAKLGTVSTNFGLRVQGAYPNRGDALFNLSTGVLIGTSSGGANTLTSATITSVGDGWYKLTVTTKFANALNTVRHIYGATSSTSVNAWEGADGALSNVYVWGAQLNIGSTAKPYFPTTDRLNVPRLDHTYGSCPALLLEPQRTNFTVYSEQFTNAAWVLDGDGAGQSVTANYSISPDGTQSADRLQLNKTGGSYSRIRQNSVQIGVYTFSVYLKSNTSSTQNVGIRLEGAGINCAVTPTWQRFSVTTTTIVNAQSQILLFDTISGNEETADISIWGAQLEAGSYATSLILTTSASATRVVDSFSRNNIYINGLITSSGGTWFVELRNNIAYVRDGAGAFPLFISSTSTSGAGSNSLEFRNATGGSSVRLSILKRIGGTGTLLFNTTTDIVKVAIKWNGTTADVFVNGAKQVSATAFTITNMEFLNGFGTDIPLFIQAMGLHPTPLTDSQCIELTTL
jgi:hypothetical protein